MKIAILFSTSIISSLVFGGRIDSLLPDPIKDIFDLLGPQGSGAVGFVVSRVQLGLFIAIGLLVLFAVIYALISAFKYIRSQGDPGEMEEAQKAIKAIFFGLAAMIIAIIGIVLVFVFFGASLPQTDLFQVCVSAPGSVGCQKCQQDSSISTCQFCEEVYKSQANKTLNDINRDGQLDNTDIMAVREINNLLGDGKNCVEPVAGGNQPTE